MGSLSAVFWLTREPDWRSRYDITVYQYGWRLGGKGTSGRERDVFDRNREHGYHVLLGFYENAFRTMRECYRELGRDPSAPLAELCAETPDLERQFPERYALHRHTRMTVAQPFVDGVHFIPLDLTLTPSLPGDPGHSLDPFAALSGVVDALWEFATGARWQVPGVSPWTPPAPSSWPRHLGRRLGALARLVGVTPPTLRHLSHPLSAARALVQTIVDNATFDAAFRTASAVIVELIHFFMRATWRLLGRRVAREWPAYQAWILLDMTASILCGLLTDRVLERGFDHLDGQNFVDWWMSHGAVRVGSRVTAGSALASLPYDLVFGYRRGDSTSPPTRAKPYVGAPDVGAGTMLKGMLRFGAYYHGAPEWMFQAGCGEVLAVPMYEVLRKRGVKFEFFQRVRGLHLDATGKNIASISMERQATVTRGEYEPLVDVKGIPCWPSDPLYDQLAEGAALLEGGVDLESYWSDWHGTDHELRRGVDFDRVLLGISIGALPELTTELSAKSRRWKAMLAGVETNRAFVLEAWFTRTLAELGATGPDLNADTFYQPVNLLSSMNPILRRESWPPGAVKSSIYYSGVLPDDPLQPPSPDPAYPPTQQLALREVYVDYLQRHSAIYLPGSRSGRCFDWSLLQSEKDPTLTGEERLDAQYWRLSIDPSERYVLSVAGSGVHRLAAGKSGFDNLTLAGDWIKIGFDCGCMEATFMSGMQAARAISGLPKVVFGEKSWK